MRTAWQIEEEAYDLDNIYNDDDRDRDARNENGYGQYGNYGQYDGDSSIWYD